MLLSLCVRICKQCKGPRKSRNLNFCCLSRKLCCPYEAFRLIILWFSVQEYTKLYIYIYLIDFCFDGGESKFIQFKKIGACWVNEVNKNCFSFNKQQMKDAVSYLLSNCYFTVDHKIFYQIIGIPMESDPVPFFANLFLYYYEFQSKWMNKLKKKDLIRTRKLCNIFRFIDDLNTLNDAGEFHHHHHHHHFRFNVHFPC